MLHSETYSNSFGRFPLTYLMIEISKLSKNYGHVQALKSASFSVRKGEVVGLLGPNGAGKTTLMKIMTGFLGPDSGKAVIDGNNIVKESLLVQKVIGYLPENAPLYPELSVQSYLKMIAELRCIPKSNQPGLLSKVIRNIGLENHLTRPISHLSKGYRQRVGLASAILHEPRVLILDEPTAGLDPTQIIGVRNLIKKLSEHSTILLSTHILSEVEAVCDRVVILLNGEVKADAKLDELDSHTEIVLVLENQNQNVLDELKAVNDVASVSISNSPDGQEYRIRPTNNQDLRNSISSLVQKNKWPLRELRRDVRTLETVFNELVSRSETTTQSESGIPS